MSTQPHNPVAAVDAALDVLIDNVGDDPELEYATRVVRKEISRLRGLCEAAGINWR